MNAPKTAVGDASTEVFFDFLSYLPSSNASSSAIPQPSSRKLRDLSAILPAVLIPCLLCITALSLALFVQRRRLMTALRQKPTPYLNRDTEKGKQYVDINSRPYIYSSLGPLFSPPALTASRTPTELDTYAERDLSYIRTESLPTSLSVEPPSMAVAIPPPSVLRARSPPSSFRPDSMLEVTRARRLRRFDGASLFSGGSIYTEDVPPTYRSRT